MSWGIMFILSKLWLVKLKDFLVVRGLNVWFFCIFLCSKVKVCWVGIIIFCVMGVGVILWLVWMKSGLLSIFFSFVKELFIVGWVMYKIFVVLVKFFVV